MCQSSSPYSQYFWKHNFSPFLNIYPNQKADLLVVCNYHTEQQHRWGEELHFSSYRELELSAKLLRYSPWSQENTIAAQPLQPSNFFKHNLKKEGLVQVTHQKFWQLQLAFGAIQQTKHQLNIYIFFPLSAHNAYSNHLSLLSLVCSMVIIKKKKSHIM